MMSRFPLMNPNAQMASRESSLSTEHDGVVVAKLNDRLSADDDGLVQGHMKSRCQFLLTSTTTTASIMDDKHSIA